MKKLKIAVINLNGKKVNYVVIKSFRSKNISLSMKEEYLIIRAPGIISQKGIESVLRRHQNWIVNQLVKLEKEQQRESPFKLEHGTKLPLLSETYRLSLKRSNNNHYYRTLKNFTVEICLPELTAGWIYPGIELWYRKMANRFLAERVRFFAQSMGVKYNRITIKNQRSLWGSCSRKANLNFNWRIMLLTPDEADYLIIHELAHLSEMNHSSRFWLLVKKHCPDYRTSKAFLKEKNHLLKFPADSMFSNNNRNNSGC